MELIKELPWTAILTVLIAILGVIAKKLFSTYVQPFLENKGLIEAATIAVDAAEAMFGRSFGEDKLRYALDLLTKDGWDVDSDIVLAAVKAAWQDLDLRQIDAGVKVAE